MPLLLHAEGTKVTVMDGKSDGSTRCAFLGEVDGEGGRSESKRCRDPYVSVLIFHPFLPFTRLPYCYPFTLNSFLAAKTGLGLYQTMLSASGLFSLYC